MKKLTKILALILVCGAFALAGCGGLSLDVSGDYKDSTEEDFTGYKASYVVSGYEFESNDNSSSGENKAESKVKGKVLFDEKGNISGLYYEESGYSKKGDVKVSTKVKYYIKDGKFYTDKNVDGNTTKTYRNQTESDDYTINSYIPNANISSMISHYAEELKYTKAEKSGYTKFKIESKTLEEGYSGKANVWIVFDKDAKAYGSKVEIDIKSDSMTVKGNFVSKQFNGKISYPSFNDFKAEA